MLAWSLQVKLPWVELHIARRSAWGPWLCGGNWRGPDGTLASELRIGLSEGAGDVAPGCQQSGRQPAKNSQIPMGVSCLSAPRRALVNTSRLSPAFNFDISPLECFIAAAAVRGVRSDTSSTLSSQRGNRRAVRQADAVCRWCRRVSSANVGSTCSVAFIMSRSSAATTLCQSASMSSNLVRRGR